MSGGQEEQPRQQQRQSSSSSIVLTIAIASLFIACLCAISDDVSSPPSSSNLFRQGSFERTISSSRQRQRFSLVPPVVATTQHRHRSLQEVTFIDANSSLASCVATTAVDYINNVLGPSAATNSLYKSITLDYTTTPGSFGTTTTSLSIRVRELAQALLEEDLRNPGNSSLPTVGRQSEQTTELRAQHETLGAFWGVSTNTTAYDPVLLVGLHSEPLRNNLERAVKAWLTKEGQLTNNEYLQYNISQEAIRQVALDVQRAIETELPNNYSSPALSYIAYYAPRFGVQDMNDDASIVVLGDGYLDFYTTLGLGAVGADMIHAHEYSHALHFQLDLDDVDNNVTAYIENFVATRSPETDRRYELEADAMGAYALAHPRGRYWNVTELRLAAQAMYSIGDCQVTEQFHHGTPLQRQCATLWGADEAVDNDNAVNPSNVTEPLSPRAFRERFLQHLDLILALDPVVCNLTDENGRNPVVVLAPPSSPLTTTTAAPIPQGAGSAPAMVPTSTDSTDQTASTATTTSSASTAAAPMRVIWVGYGMSILLMTLWSICL